MESGFVRDPRALNVGRPGGDEPASVGGEPI